MQLTASKALAVMALLTSAMASPMTLPMANVKRSLPALQGWSGNDFNGTSEYLTFCVPDSCCFPSKTAPQGNQVPVNLSVESLSVMYADVLLKDTSEVLLWKNGGCTGEATAAFNAFKGKKNLKHKTTVGSFKFCT